MLRFSCGAVKKLRESGLPLTVLLGRQVEPQQLGQPARPDEEAFRLAGHIAFLQVSDQLRLVLSEGLAYRFEDPRLRHPVQLVIGRRLPALADHVEADGTGDAICAAEPAPHDLRRGAAVVVLRAFVDSGDAKGDEVREQFRTRTVVQGDEVVPEGVLVGRKPGFLGVAALLHGERGGRMIQLRILDREAGFDDRGLEAAGGVAEGPGRVETELVQQHRHGDAGIAGHGILQRDGADCGQLQHQGVG